MPTEELDFETELDINDPSLMEGEALSYDMNEDFQARSAPPPKGRYKLRLFIDDEKIERGLKQGFKKTDPNGWYYKKSLSCKIQDPSGVWQDSIVGYNVSTGIPRGKKISTMIGLLIFLKVKVQPGMTELAVAKLFIKAMVKLDGPILIADCDWQGWDSDNVSKRQEFGTVATLSETKKLANTMLNFPKKADGTYSHIGSTAKGAKVFAKLKLIEWVPLKAKPVEGAAKPAVVSQLAKPVAAKPLAAPVVVESGLEIEGEAIELGDDGEVVLEV